MRKAMPLATPAIDYRAIAGIGRTLGDDRFSRTLEHWPERTELARGMSALAALGLNADNHTFITLVLNDRSLETVLPNAVGVGQCLITTASVTEFRGLGIREIDTALRSLGL